MLCDDNVPPGTAAQAARPCGCAGDAKRDDCERDRAGRDAAVLRAGGVGEGSAALHKSNKP